MKKLGWLLLSCFIANQIPAQLIQKDLSYFINKTPFKMPKVEEPSFNNATLFIHEFGAVPDGKTINTPAINKAIIACHKQGGGKVIIGAGTWLTGPIELLSNVNLVLEKGALLQFTKDFTQYPIIKAGKTSNTFNVASPIYAYSAENIAITGEGMIDGAGDAWRPVKKSKTTASQWDALTKTGVLSADGKIWWPTTEAMNGEEYLKNIKSNGKGTLAEDYAPARVFMRPHMVFFVDCKKVLIQDVTIRNSPTFIFYPSKCSNLSIKNAHFFNEWWAQNGDAIDISACKNVIIYNTTVNAGDDGICMKSSGKSEQGANLENILIANCVVYRAHGGFVIGSNTDGGMSHIFVTNCYFNGTDIGIRVKSNSGRGGKVAQIFIDSIAMDNIREEAISFDTYYEDVVAGKEKKDVQTTANDKVPEFTQFFISNILCKKATTGLYINGLAYMPVHDIQLSNVQITADKGIDINYAQNIRGNNVVFNSKKTPTIKNATEIIFNNQDLK